MRHHSDRDEASAGCPSTVPTVRSRLVALCFAVLVVALAASGARAEASRASLFAAATAGDGASVSFFGELGAALSDRIAALADDRADDDDDDDDDEGERKGRSSDDDERERD